MSRRIAYSGRYSVTLDAKSRVILPAALRKLAEAELLEGEDRSGEFKLTAYTAGCLHLYTSVGFNRQLDLMRDNTDEIGDPHAYDGAEIAFQRFLHDSVSLSLGEQGRLLIPADLASQAGLEKSTPVTIVGSDHVIGIWNAEAYSARFGTPNEAAPRTADQDGVLRQLTRRRRKPTPSRED